MNYIHARRFKRSKLVFSGKVAFTLLLPWIRRLEDFLPFYAILVQLDTFTVLRQNALTFTLSPPYEREAKGSAEARKMGRMANGAQTGKVHSMR
jgi:hypothetical protein